MSTINNRKIIQSPDHRLHSPRREYQVLQDLIFDQEGISCSILITPTHLSIRTKDYADYVLARRVIRGRVSCEIVRDIS